MGCAAITIRTRTGRRVVIYVGREPHPREVARHQLQGEIAMGQHDAEVLAAVARVFPELGPGDVEIRPWER